MLRRVALGLAILLAAVLAGVPGWIALHRDDLPAVDDADLEAERLPLAPGEDGFAALREAADALVWPEPEDEAHERLGAMLRGEAWEPAWLEARLRENAAAFAALELGLAAPALRIPVYRIEDDELADVLLPVQTLVKLAALRSRLRLASGDERGAFESALLGMRVGRELSAAQRPHLLSMMFAAADQGIGLFAVERLLGERSLSQGRVRDLVARLESSRWEAESWERAWATEYRSLRGSIREAAEVYGSERTAATSEHAGLQGRLLRWLPADYVFQPNRTLDELADTYRELGQRAALSCRDAHPRTTRGLRSTEVWSAPSPWQTVRTLLSPNSAGRLVLEIGTPNLLRFDWKRCHLETRISLVQALAALVAYRSATDELPERLEALVPEYLPAVPEDRFDGEPLRWSRERGVVWSVGQDLSDDGPPAEPSQGEASAPAVSLAPAQPSAAVLPRSSSAKS